VTEKMDSVSRSSATTGEGWAMASPIKWAIEESDIRWTMEWKDKPAEEIFEEEDALAHMLINGVIFLNSHWWREDWKEEDRRLPSLNVNCNDVFAWACADAEPLPHGEIKNLYDMWRKDPRWGPAVWCIMQRRQMPQAPVEKRIRAAGIWDLDALGLNANTQDAEVHAKFVAFAQAQRATARHQDTP